MKKLLLILLILLGIFLGLIIALPILFKGKIVEKIKQVVNEELTATVNFDNDISLSLLRSFPNLSIIIDQIEVVNSGKFAGDTLITMKEFKATLDIMSVIKGDEIRIRSIFLNEPRIHARVLADGSANWDIVKPAEKEEKIDTTEEAAPFKISLKKYEIKDAHVVYDDEQGKMYAELAGFNHKGKGDFSQDDFILETVTTIQSLTYSMDGIDYLNKVNTELTCDMGINMPAMRFDFKENSLRLNALVIGFDGFLAMPDDNITMDMKVVSQKASFKEILSLIPAVYSKDFDNLQTTGTTALDLNVKGVLNTALETYPAFEVKLLVENGTFAYPDLPEKLNDIQIKLRINNADGHPDHTVVNLDKLHFLFGREPFDARLMLTKPVSNPYVELMAKGLVVLDNVNKLIPLDAGTRLSGKLRADLNAKGHVSTFEGDDYEVMNAAGSMGLENFVYTDGKSTPLELTSMNMTFSPKELVLSDLNGKYGHSDYQAKGSIQNYLAYLFKEGETLIGNVELKSGLFDCNAFLTEDGSEQKEAPSPNDTMELEAFLIPENIDLNVDLAMNKVLYDNLVLDQVGGSAKVKEQVLYLNNVKLGMFGGTVSMNGTYSTKNPVQPAAQIKLGLENVGIKETFSYFNTIKIIAPIAEHISGKMNASLDLSTLLNQDMSPILSSITSTGLLKTTQAVISGFQPLNALADKLQLDMLKSIDIAGTTIAYAVQDGKVFLKKPLDLKIKDILLHVEEEGFTTFEQLLNYRLKLSVPRALLGAGGNQAINGLMAEAGKLGINVKPGDKIDVNALLGGTVKNPKITTSLGDIKDNAIDQIKEEGKRIVEEKKEEVIKKVDEEAQKLIDQANQKGDQLIAAAKKQAETLKATAKKEGDAVIAEADKRAAELLSEAGNNPVKKLAAQKAGDRLKQEAREKANRLNSEADKQGQTLIGNAEKEKAKLVAEAEAKKNSMK